jgi:hypothetical protein
LPLYCVGLPRDVIEKTKILSSGGGKLGEIADIISLLSRRRR